MRVPTLMRGAAACWGYMAHYKRAGSPTKGAGAFVISLSVWSGPDVTGYVGGLKLPAKAEQSPQSPDESCPPTHIFTCPEGGPEAQRREESDPKRTRAEAGQEPKPWAFRLGD